MPSAPRTDARAAARAKLSRVRREGIRNWFQEGLFAQVWITLTGGKFLTDLALFFGAGPFHLGLINAVPYLSAPGQILGAYLSAWSGTRRPALVLGAGASRMIWLLVLLLVLLPIPQHVKLWLFIACFAISGFGAAVATNPWTTWTGDLVPEAVRGRLVSVRTAALLLVGLGADFLISQLREQLGPDGRRWTLVVMLALACAAAVHTIFLFRKWWEPPLKPAPIPRFGQVLRASVRERGVRRLLFAFALWNMGIGVAVGFWAPHMMQNLELPFTKILIYHTALYLLSFIMNIGIWGGVIDRVGAVPVLMFNGVILAGVPFLWLFITPENLMLYYIEGAISGFAWSGFNTATFSLPYKVLPEKNRSFFFAILSALNGLMMGLGSVLGGLIAEGLEGLALTFAGYAITNYHIVFFLSGGIRAVSLTVLRRVQESGRRRGGVGTAARGIVERVEEIMDHPEDLLPRTKSSRKGQAHVQAPAAAEPQRGETKDPADSAARSGRSQSNQEGA